MGAFATYILRSACLSTAQLFFPARIILVGFPRADEFLHYPRFPALSDYNLMRYCSGSYTIMHKRAYDSVLFGFITPVK